ncbi:MAG: DUF485 domain-containing protein [Sulfurimonas sp.]|jgi:uncharacterized membrane protein (DUF485 family)|uniref:DUF485 domain-containing protein n=1 Tax=unclassified Sulfurimonas TaxID=2623549 RepID=UPI0008BA4E85|nr:MULTISPECIES: DUF485 domain-containing protein [unclassified Sulfurimonas]OHE11252.1 MAG: hypothetical protein A3J96_07270 [Sulfurimonas sp. RIFOXYC2_FULL_36_7]OHE11420.1 MAG: hypothetical protein A2525_06905 [Sulfurimonas sp. RIFOXYD12_FULL_36_11]OHE18884.1 MAG: hypothetical protein A2540_06755 [Sulfurimonas sp. RIFOXYD2_FULL_37_8]MBS4067512.1 DUF485 domain-containing protein [Sulfurimonas sp.]MDD3854139.1 DUF485 domain-containing protein [Sulfurimonas sp.]
MNKETVEKIKANPDYQKLISTRNSFAVKLSILMLVVYFLFILLIAFNPAFLGTPLSSGSVTTVGIPVGMGIIVFAIVLTGIYTKRANGEFDDLSNSVKNSLKDH